MSCPKSRRIRTPSPSLGALMVSTASRVGTGNIVGVSSAICVGGYGAVFWMWITAILGGASAFIESTLAQIYKKRDGDGSSYGGPSYYMEDALHQRWLGVVFAVIIILTYAVGYNALASYNLQSAFAGFSFYKPGVTPYVLGGILAVLFAVCVLGGAKRLTSITGILVPVMGVIYIIVSLIVICINIGNIPSVFANIFRSAFDFKAIFGGFLGSAMMQGIKRGLYSTRPVWARPRYRGHGRRLPPRQAGPCPDAQRLYRHALICTATALMCLSTGIEPTAELQGAPYVQQTMAAALGSFGPVFIAVSMCLFAFTTLIGNYYYCEGCLKHILKRHPSKTFMLVFRLAASVIVLIGATVSMGLAWDTADLFQALMVIINIPVIIILAKPALLALNDYMKQRKEGRIRTSRPPTSA